MKLNAVQYNTYRIQIQMAQNTVYGERFAVKVWSVRCIAFIHAHPRILHKRVLFQKLQFMWI